MLPTVQQVLAIGVLAGLFDMRHTGRHRLHQRPVVLAESQAQLVARHFRPVGDERAGQRQLRHQLGDIGGKGPVDESDVGRDFFAGSNTTGCVAESLHRRWLALENVEDYLKASTFRFE